MAVFYPRAVVKIDAVFKSVVGGTRPASWLSVPTRVEWNRNDSRHADTCKITLLYRDFPLDPRMLSFVHVQVFVGDVRNNTVELPLTPQNLRFQGFVDTPESSLSSTRSTVTFDCRDYTATYLDRSWRRVADEEEVPRESDEETGKPRGQRRTRIVFSETQTLRQFVQQIRDRLSPDGPTAIRRPPLVFDNPEVADLPLVTRAGRENLSMDNEESAWDALTKVCEWFGQIPTWTIDPTEGPVLFIRAPSSASRFTRFPKLEYGRNVRSITLRRNMTGPEERYISVVCWNPTLGEVLRGVAPAVGLASGETIYEGNQRGGTRIKSNIKRVQYLIEGEYTQADLDDIAAAIYDGQAQRRIKGTVSTVNMVDLEGTVDLLAVSNADRLTCRIGPDVVQGVEHLSDGAAIRYLSDPARRNALPVDVASVLVESRRQVQELQVEFFVLEARHVWDAQSGYEVEVDFTDFLFDVIRANPDRLFGT